MIQRALTSKRILVCDDEPHIARLVQIFLERRGHHVDLARDGREALDCMDTHPPDLILLDMMMPRMNGFEFLQNLKDSDAQAPPVIVVTALSEDADIAKCYDHGAAHVLVKPFNAADLAHHIELA